MELFTLAVGASFAAGYLAALAVLRVREEQKRYRGL